MNILLSWSEVLLAAQCGSMRQVASLKDDRKDQHGYDGSDGWTKHIEGAAGEMAAAKALELYWSPTINHFKRPDIGGNIQVRTRSKHDWDLIYRPQSDSPDDIFVLVTGTAPEYYVHGWVVGYKALELGTLETYGNRPAAYFVKQENLFDLQTLKSRLHDLDCLAESSESAHSS